MQERRTTRAEFVAYFRRHRGLVCAVAFLLLCHTACTLAPPQILRVFVDNVPADTDPSVPANNVENRLLLLGGLYTLTALAVPVLALALSALCHRFALGWGHQLRLALLAHGIAAEPDLVLSAPAAELVDRTVSETSRLTNALHLLSSAALPQLVALAGVLCALAWADPRFLLPPFLALLIALTARRLVGGAVAMEAREHTAHATMLGWMEDRLRGAVDLHGAGAVGSTGQEAGRRLAALKPTALEAARISARWPLTAQSAGVVAFLGVLALGVALHRQGEITLGTLFASLNYMTTLRSQLTALTSQSRELRRLRVAVRSADEILAVPVPRRGGAPVPAGPLDLELHGVSAGYGQAADTLHGLDLFVPAGTRAGIVGRTGSGKTTLLRVLSGGLSPRSGRVRIGGADLADLDLDRLRRRVLVLPQQVQVLSGTVRDNVRLFDPAHGEDVVVDALTQAGLSDWLSRLPHGLDTVLTPARPLLSGGEGQLLVIARTLLRDPGAVLLDETTARLDGLAEKTAQQALSRFLVGRTVVVVTHRTGELRDVQQVLSLETEQ